MSTELKKLLNTLRCPICKCQIDIINVKKLKHNFACAQNYLHYSLYISQIDLYSSIITSPRIEQERATVDDRLFQFEITQNFIDLLSISGTETIIIIKKIDAEGRVLELPFKTFKYDKILFNFKNLDKSKIINRVNTVLTFQ